jgi:hypothetical protein
VLAFAPQAGAAVSSSACIIGEARFADARPRVATRAPISAASVASVASGAERAALRAAQDPHLAQLRAGASAEVHPLSADQRAALERAKARAEGLSALRAGDLQLSDRDIGIVAAVVLATVLIIVLL